MLSEKDVKMRQDQESLIAGLPRSGKSQGKTKIFQGQGKVRENL